MSYFPLFLDIKNKKFLIVGAGNVALAKLEAVLDFTYDVTIVAKDNNEQISRLVANAGLKFIKEEYKKKHLKGCDIVIAATNDKRVNAKISDDAKELGLLVNVVDDPENSVFIFGANIKRGNLVISTGTSGTSPVLARLLKRRINSALPDNLFLFSDFVEDNKNKVRKKFTDLQSRRLFWQDVLDGVIGQEISAGNIEKAQELFDNILEERGDGNQAAVYFVSAGPGDPELITLKAVRLISQADVVLYDRLVSEEILNYARRDAEKINVGKKKGEHCYIQDEINDLITEHALEGKIVVRLKGGDSSIFAHLGEEISVVSKLNIPYQVVPGITAASAAAAYSGIPLTSREFGKSVRFITIYKDDLVDDDYWSDLAKSGDTLAFYMSSSKINDITNNLIKFGRDSQTPLLVIEQTSTIYQKSFASTLGQFKIELADKEFTSPSILIIGEVVQFYHENHWKEENRNGVYFREPLKAVG